MSLKRPIFPLKYNERIPTRLYHGTSDALNIEVIHPPKDTGIMRDETRNDFMDKVFMTSSIRSAWRYAKKACARLGGSPVVYMVQPVGDVLSVRDHEYIAELAVVV